MKFNKETLKELAGYCGVEGFEVLEDEIVDTTRWSEIHSLVFKYDGKYYSTGYSKGLTEMQDESPFEYEDDEIECEEVFPTEVTVIQYLTKKQQEALNG